MTVKRTQIGARMSQAVVHGDTVYLSGQVADDPLASFAEQTKQILSKIDRLLVAVGSGKSRILSANIWLADIGRLAEMNELWDAWASPSAAPAQVTVQSALARPRNLVEIMIVAALDQGARKS